MTGLEDVTHALTLTCPWASIMIDGPKPIENREWAPPAWVIGKRIALHAGKVFDDRDWIRAQAILVDGGVDPIEAMETWKNWKVRGAIIGTALVTRFIDDADPVRTPVHHSPWFFGRFGWLLDERQSLPAPIPCRGFQKLWRIPDELRRAA